MKISKSLLSAIAAGIVMSAASSCDTTNEVIERGEHTENCSENCTSEHNDRGESGSEVTWDNCPACGMG